MRRRHLFILAALIWGVPGVGITLKGIAAYRNAASGELWWMLLGTAAVCLWFYFLFSRIVNRYSERILALPQKVNALMAFPPSGWVLIVFMMGLGITLRYIPDIPYQFTASFYCGLGPMLILSAAKFLIRAGIPDMTENTRFNW